jgi:acyl-CoA synthetase (AMP-forming)/AMP-acid ligase II
MQLPAISDCVCVAAQHPVMGIVPKLLVVLAPHAEFNKRAIAKALAQQLESYKVPLIYEQVASIQRTYNGKINRRAYVQS